MQKAYYLPTPHLERSMIPKDLYKYMHACVHARLFGCQNEGECMRERERERVMRLSPRI